MSEGGKVIDGYLSIGRDITERLEAEQLIQYQHKNITDSVTYASRIKSAILPGEAALKALFTHVAVYNKPKDIIGGDFYWMGQNGKKYLFAFGDCTGHGVPGAFMTTISVGLLRETLKEDPNWNVEELLGLFNRSLVKLLGSNSEIESPDFVEMALLSVDFENNKIQFISSGIGLHVLSKGEFTSYQEGSRGQNYKYDYRGMGKEISIQPGDVYYLFTDGMFDQLGGPKNKRLTKKGLLEIIRNSNQISLTQGIEEIKTGIETWQDSFAQIDDRLLISFRF
jgi:serine phosphatase RsbU (regulator of sigma subunit)